jgi:hypothetical protein
MHGHTRGDIMAEDRGKKLAIPMIAMLVAPTLLGIGAAETGIQTTTPQDVMKAYMEAYKEIYGDIPLEVACENCRVSKLLWRKPWVFLQRWWSNNIYNNIQALVRALSLAGRYGERLLGNPIYSNSIS